MIKIMENKLNQVIDIVTQKLSDNFPLAEKFSYYNFRHIDITYETPNETVWSDHLDLEKKVSDLFLDAYKTVFGKGHRKSRITLRCGDIETQISMNLFVKETRTIYKICVSITCYS